MATTKPIDWEKTGKAAKLPKAVVQAAQLAQLNDVSTVKLRGRVVFGQRYNAVMAVLAPASKPTDAPAKGANNG